MDTADWKISKIKITTLQAVSFCMEITDSVLLCHIFSSMFLCHTVL